MKIVLLSFYSGTNFRGVEMWAESLKSHIAPRFDIDIISGRKGETVFTNVLRNVAKVARGDIVIPTNGRLQALICRLVTLLTGRPLIVFGHSGPGADDKFNLLCSPSVFVAFTPFQKRWAQDHKLPWTKVILLPHAVDTKKFTPAPQKPKKDVVLCVGANEPSKRITLVQDAVKRLPGVEFLAVGRGNPVAVPFDQMPGIYKKATIFSFVPVPWEAFGLVYLEAMASGLPVVAPDDPIRRAIVGSAGIFVKNPKNPDELVAAIKEALNKDWKNLPRKQAEKFSWDIIIKDYESFFDILIR